MWLVPSTWNQLHWSSIAQAKFERCILNPWSQMDYTGACFSLDGISLTGGLNSTWFTPRMASVDGTTTLICDQKLDRLLLISAAQATHLTQARSAQKHTAGVAETRWEGGQVGRAAGGSESRKDCSKHWENPTCCLCKQHHSYAWMNKWCLTQCTCFVHIFLLLH